MAELHLLIDVSKVFQNNLRIIDTVCRYGGDEFVVILPGTGAEQTHIAAEKIKKSVEALALKQKMSLSIGISSYKNQWGRLDFISRADEALYQAKRGGKHRICVYR